MPPFPIYNFKVPNSVPDQISKFTSEVFTCCPYFNSLMYLVLSFFCYLRRLDIQQGGSIFFFQLRSPSRFIDLHSMFLFVVPILIIRCTYFWRSFVTEVNYYMLSGNLVGWINQLVLKIYNSEVFGRDKWSCHSYLSSFSNSYQRNLFRSSMARYSQFFTTSIFRTEKSPQQPAPSQSLVIKERVGNSAVRGSIR